MKLIKLRWKDGRQTDSQENILTIDPSEDEEQRDLQRDKKTDKV
jgi:hypothetical protein